MLLSGGYYSSKGHLDISVNADGFSVSTYCMEGSQKVLLLINGSILYGLKQKFLASPLIGVVDRCPHTFDNNVHVLFSLSLYILGPGALAHTP